MMVVELPNPVATMRELLHGPMQQSVVQSEIWALAKKRPEYAVAEGGWRFLLQPAGGDAELFVASFAGDGLFLAAMPGVEGDAKQAADWVLLGFGHDGDLAQDCLMPPLQLQGIERAAFRGESWEIVLDERISLLREGNRFLVGSNRAYMKQLSTTPRADLDAWLQNPSSLVTDNEITPDLRGWILGDALREDGFEEKPANAAASYLVGELHEALRTAPWLSMSFDIDGHSLQLEFTAPASEEMRSTHRPFFPTLGEIPMPLLDQLILEGVFTRELATWWAGRADYLTERGLNETIEGDGALKLLFGRDPAADVFLHLEPEIRWLLAPLDESTANNLSVEYAALAMGFRFKQDAPKDLEQAFANAFLSAITFANFDTGQSGQPTLEMNMKMDERGKMYSAAYPKWPHESKKPERYNFSPSLLILPDGELWISSSLGLLEEIASAPVKLVSASGMWLEFQMQDLMQIVERDRAHFVANRMLEEGGDLEAAEQFVDLAFGLIRLIDSGSVRSFLKDDRMLLQLELGFTP